ncbi:MAG: hypothetical protein ACREPM_17375 [Gemmatimonadaceae bacterium]
MAIRVFTDSQGVEWRVWSTVPSSAASVSPELSDGWLSFDSGVQRRRVGPIPPGWESASDERLELICRVASPTRWSDPFGITIPLTDSDDLREERPR